ncbi:hypothetical protein Ais01nite_72670 [Asanoa ishikariensis]|uniref:Uncharacterized protein n=2 Tax=Asanoa ishikariensis TaxID=137265 RepID=A0A1H3UQG5_9ACTN|nr:hypothetical protein Ais01nite_72670 [Asanoa ishikariensis]SDZ64634.1 hypothetical protein SAMN05421684_7801 [Asanoa ishikariensis]
MRARGWAAGFLRAEPDQRALAELAAGPDPVLVVVDDAHLRGADVAALGSLFSREQQARVLLVGQGLRDALAAPFETLGYPYLTESPELTAVASAESVWRDAVAALAPRLPEVAASVPWAFEPPRTSPVFVDRGGVPATQLAALDALLGGTLLRWESWHWFQRGLELGLFFTDASACAPLGVQAAIWGADTRDEALRLGPHADWPAALYPGPGRFWRFPRALATHLAALDRSDERGRLDVPVAMYSSQLSIRLSDLGHSQEAARASGAAVDLIRPHTTNDAGLTVELARMLRNHAADLVAASECEAAVRVVDEAVDLHRRLVLDGFGGSDVRWGLAAVLFTRAEAVRDLGRPADGYASVHEALAVVERVASEAPDVAAAWRARAAGLLAAHIDTTSAG